MIQHDSSPLRPRCGIILATVGFTEPGTSTVQDWDFCEYGSERIWQLHGGNEQSGSVDIRAMLTWLMNKGHLPQGSKLSPGRLRVRDLQHGPAERELPGQQQLAHRDPFRQCQPQPVTVLA